MHARVRESGQPLPTGLRGRLRQLCDYRFLRFAIVGGINTSVDFAIFSLLVFVAGWTSLTANVCSYSVGVCCSFTLNRIWTFSDTAHERRASHQFLLFLTVNIVTLCLSTAVIFFVQQAAPVLVAKAVAIFAGLAINYFGSRLFVFNRGSAGAIKE